MSDKPRGRPPLDPSGQPSIAVTVKLVKSDLDRAAQAAKRGESVQDVIRRGLRRLLTDERGGAI